MSSLWAYIFTNWQTLTIVNKKPPPRRTGAGAGLADPRASGLLIPGYTPDHAPHIPAIGYPTLSGPIACTALPGGIDWSSRNPGKECRPAGARAASARPLSSPAGSRLFYSYSSYKRHFSTSDKWYSRKPFSNPRSHISVPVVYLATTGPSSGYLVTISHNCPSWGSFPDS